jgi:FkbH-like protein
MEFKDLKKNLKKDVSAFRKVRMALLGDSATQFVAQAIRGTGVEFSLNIELFESEFNQIDRQIFDPDSELYAFDPETVVIFESTHKLLQKFNKTQPSERKNFAHERIADIKQLVAMLQSRSRAKIIFCNFTEEDDRVFGQYANKTADSFIFQIRKLNVMLQEFAAATTGNFFICDLSTVQNTVGRERFWSPSIYVNTEMVVSIDALPAVAMAVVQTVLALGGQIRKCVVIDLDNTVWGGVIGDDGIENIQIGQLGIGKAFTEFQYWLKKLQQRGIILAVCSKNTESVAKEPFEKHPDMVLRLTDIAVFVANWENKADNIRQIQKILNIGFDSMVFLDDNPFERNIVRENIPQITVPELPEDPALYLDYLYSLNLFETASYSAEDSARTEQYRKEAERVIFQQSFTDENDFLKSLDMQSEVKPFDRFTIPRVAQLSQRSNQFNLRTVRYTEDDVARIAASDEYFTLSFTLTDKFGDNGLIAAVILNKNLLGFKNLTGLNASTLFIDTWFMSCRVLKRGMEAFTLNAIVALAKSHGYKTIVGEYVPTAKNAMVSEHYKKLGFSPAGENLWALDVESYKKTECYIQKI